ncbi:MAG: T9SS type A sorting domain-containing protein [Chitinispirillaceae bacterium]|nr:T9SS type A sorting domain-containing protein [Chitinispirillaceae bacterium]
MRFTALAMIMGALAISGSAQEKTLTDESIEAGETVTLSKDTTYILDGKVFVEEGAVLNIQAGTVIKGEEGSGDDASALIICRGARIYAKGTKYNPIIFTAKSDEMGNLSNTDKGLWGGVVILGNAVTNEGEDEIEGIAAGDERTLFGGDDDDDTSGVLQYVSIRHSGITIAPDNELNGLSMAAVGRGTVVDHVEFYCSSDDGVESWGGCWNGSHLVASFCDDDAFDIDQGYRGTLQFLFAIQDSIAEGMSANFAGEWDGDDTKGAEPYALWNVYNATFIGGGSTANSNNAGIILRANGAAKVYNSIFTSFKKNRGLVIEDLQDEDAQDSRKRFEDGDIVFGNNIFWDVGGAESLDSIMRWYYKDEEGSSQYPAAEELLEKMEEWDNTYENPELTKIAYGMAALDPTLSDDSPAMDNLAAYPEDNDFVKEVSYKGAFENDNWMAYWTALWDEGILADVETEKPEVVLRDSDIEADGELTLEKDNVYILSEKVFVEEGAVLTIEAGTVIKGVEEKGENSAALIICRGAKIIAEGTQDEPIIFTAYSDDLDDPEDLTNMDKGLWGGVVLLGNAVTNEEEDEVEGIAAGDERAKFGGDDDEDSSGILRYVSIRHSGVTIAPNNELNGLSLAAIGSKTVLENIEVFASSDDGFEWWGGTVNGKNLIAAFCDDDGFDIDQGYRGTLQFIFCIQDSIAEGMSANWAGEWDGDDTKGAEPFAQWTIYNATFIGGGSTANSNNAGIKLSANGAAKVYNSLFLDFKKNRGVVIEDLQDESQDSRKRFEDGDIVFGNNIFWNVGGEESIDDIMRWYYKDEEGKSQYPVADELVDSMKEWSNELVDPELTSIGYAAGKNGLNPRPQEESPAFSDLAEYPESDFVEAVGYKGAFLNNWASKWSFLSEGGYFTEEFIAVKKSLAGKNSIAPAIAASFRQSLLNVSYTVPTDGSVSLRLYNLGGKRIANLVDGFKKSGRHQVSTDITGIANGMYICNLTAGTRRSSSTITINR